MYDTCRTYRRFEQKPVEPELLRTLADVARKRSCGRNGQCLRFTVVESPANVKAMQPLLRWAAALPKEIGTPKEGEQPVAFVVVSRPKDANPHHFQHRCGHCPGCHGHHRLAAGGGQRHPGSGGPAENRGPAGYSGRTGSGDGTGSGLSLPPKHPGSWRRGKTGLLCG